MVFRSINPLKEQPNEFRKIPAMMVFLEGDRRIKCATYNNGAFWGSAHFIDADGDGRDDILRLVENPGKDTHNTWRLIDAFFVTDTGELEPMNETELAKEIDRHNRELNGLRLNGAPDERHEPEIIRE